MKLVTVAEMRAIEQEADSNGLSYAKMMENAVTAWLKKSSDWHTPSRRKTGKYWLWSDQATTVAMRW